MAEFKYKDIIAEKFMELQEKKNPKSKEGLNENLKAMDIEGHKLLGVYYNPEMGDKGYAHDAEGNKNMYMRHGPWSVFAMGADSENGLPKGHIEIFAHHDSEHNQNEKNPVTEVGDPVRLVTGPRAEILGRPYLDKKIRNFLINVHNAHYKDRPRKWMLEESVKEVLTEKNLYEEFEILNESKKIDFLKGHYEKNGLSTSHDSHAEHTDPSDIIDHFATNADPTKKKIYTHWIVDQYAKKNIRQEDIDRIKNTLNDVHTYKNQLGLNHVNDVFKFGSLKEMGDSVRPLLGTAATNAEKKEEIKHEGQELKYEDDKIKIYHLKTKEASQALYGGGYKGDGGTGTDWCTAARSDRCMFDHYTNKGNLHVVHDKETGKVYQYHVGDAQFMDAEDNTISNEDLMRLGPSLHKAWKSDPGLTE